MFFSGKRVNKISRYLRSSRLERPQFIYHVPMDDDGCLAQIGFSKGSVVGDTILPNSRGPVTKFNAEGKWLVHKDQPLENRLVGQSIWRWKEFRGKYGSQEREKIIDRYRDCYPRTFIEPPSLELTIQIVAGKRRLVTVLPENSNEDLIKHCINLYLEIFGQCHITDKPDEIPIVTPKRVNWKILPDGANPWERAEHAVTERMSESSSDQKFIITDRQRYICSLNPNEVYAGVGGFSDYLAYIFQDKNKAVLESVVQGNAIYIFEGDWKSLSQLTKRQILSENLQFARIIHATGWPQRLKAELER